MSFIRKIKNKMNQFYYSDSLKFDSKRLSQIIEKNRFVLSSAPDFVSDKILKNSVFGYGIPHHYFSENKNWIDRKINDDPTYTDMIVYLSERLQKINYLEIGVSVGKNLFQIMNSFSNASITCYDAEELNPILNPLFDFSNEEITTWNAKQTVKNSTASFRSKINFSTNTIDYVSADVFDQRGWKCLSGQKFNLILSDAAHTPEALLFEFEMLKKYELIDKNGFIIFWDDLGGEMTDAFVKIIKQLRSLNEVSIRNCFILSLNGWIGEHEKKHNIGIISNLNLNE